MPDRIRFAAYLLSLVTLAGCAGVQVGGSGRALTYGEDAEANYQAAYEAYEAGRCLDAEPQFRRIQRDFPYSDFAALMNSGGDCQLSQGQYEAIQTTVALFVFVLRTSGAVRRFGLRRHSTNRFK